MPDESFAVDGLAEAGIEDRFRDLFLGRRRELEEAGRGRQGIGAQSKTCWLRIVDLTKVTHLTSSLHTPMRFLTGQIPRRACCPR